MAEHGPTAMRVLRQEEVPSSNGSEVDWEFVARSGDPAHVLFSFWPPPVVEPSDPEQAPGHRIRLRPVPSGGAISVHWHHRWENTMSSSTPTPENSES